MVPERTSTDRLLLAPANVINNYTKMIGYSSYFTENKLFLCYKAQSSKTVLGK